MAGLIYCLASGKQINPWYTTLPMLLSAVCSVCYHKMAHPEKLPKLTSKSSLIAMIAAFALTVASVIAIIALG